jgi:hypothetical protein
MTQTLNWRTQATCRGNPDLFTTTRTAADVHLALHICRHHCPVAAQCHTEAVGLPTFLRHQVVLGGVAYDTNGRPSTRQQAVRRCGSCRRSDEERAEDEGPDMDRERELDEAEADREAEQAWLEERP